MKEVLEYTRNIEECMMEITILLNQEFASIYQDELSHNQRLVLLLLNKNKSLTVREIAAKLNVSASAISQMVTKLEDMHFITRLLNPNDRRIVKLRLDEKGKAALKNMESARIEIISKYVSKMPIDDLKALSEKIHKFRDVLIKEREKIV